jgi:mono/diheme cytochrome c family protein
MICSAGCSSSRRDEPFTRQLDVSRDPKLFLGQYTFYQNCNVCHPGGSAGFGPALNHLPLPAWFIKSRVRNGLGAMPPFDENRLPADRLDAVASYLKALRELGG